MEKTPEIVNEIRYFKRGLDINKHGIFIEYGSFYRFEKKFINDIDIHFLTNNYVTIDLINEIMNKLNDDNKIKMLVLKCGKVTIEDIYDLSYFTKLYEKKLINKYDFERIELGIKNKLNENFLRTLIDDILELKWSYQDFLKGHLYFDDIKYKLEDLIINSFIWFEFIYFFKENNYLVEFIVMPKYKFNSQRQGEIYKGCVLALNEINVNNYYNFIKRLKSCYAVMLKRKLYQEDDYNYIKSTFEKIKKYLTKNEKNISIYHKMLIDFKLKKDDDSIYKLMNNFNSNFKKISEKYFEEGKYKHLIY
jgi:hypothetical protein